MAKTTKATSRSGRKGRSGEAYNANHNTLEATRKNQPHIDPERMGENVYIRFDRNCKPHSSKGGNGGFNATQHEKERYEELFGEGLKARNERYEATRHTERCRTISELYSDPKTAPMEFLWQVGNSKCDLTTKEMRDALVKAFNETYKILRNEYGANIIPLDCGLHMDEKVPHIHFRVAMGAEDKFGNFVPNQNAALAAMGFERPDPSKPQSRYNSPLISFSDKVREIFYQACERQGIQIDREVKSASHRQVEILEYKCEQLRKEAAEARQQAQTAQMALDKVLGDTQTLENKIVALEASQKALEERNRVLSQEKGTLKSENQSLRQENLTLQNENDELCRQSNQLQAEIRTLIQQRNALRTAEKEAREAREAAVAKLTKIEDHERLLYQSAKRYVKRYKTIPAQEEKKSITGKVKQEALPERVIISTEDLDRMEELTSIYHKVEYNHATMAQINQKINTDEVVQGLRQQIQNKDQEIKSLNATISQRDKTIKQQGQTIQQHQDYLDARHLNFDFEQHQNEDIEQTQSFTFHHRRI